MAPHLLLNKKRQKDVNDQKKNTTTTTTSNMSNNNNNNNGNTATTTTATTTSTRNIFRHCLDVVNLLLIGLFVLKACTDIQPCSVLAKAATATAAEEKQPAIVVSSPGEAVVQQKKEETSTGGYLRAVATPTSTTTTTTTTDVIEEQDTYVIPIDYERFLSDGQTVVVVLASSGLGSNIIQLLAQKLFYNDRKFNFIVDDSQYGYKWDENIGLIKGFFDPHFPVFNQGDYQTILQREPYNLPTMEVINSNAAYKKARSTDQQILVQWSINESFRNDFRTNYGIEGIPLYDRFVAEACSNLQFNPRARHAIRQFIKQQSPNIPDDLRQTHSVAFHVRRGDKVSLGESRAFAGTEYVNKLIELRNRKWINPTREIEHCFVASDDVAAVEEVRKALIDNNFNCQFHTLVSRTEAEAGTAKAAYNQRDSTIQFLAEISLLLDATYFIGSFNSNVGSLAAILRKCHYFGAPHYAHSYGVDREGWFYRS